MILPDVNVLLYALREDVPEHASYRPWLEQVVGGDEPFGLSELVLSAVVRIATQPRVYRGPLATQQVLAYVEGLRGQPHAVVLRPGAAHWRHFAHLCRAANATGKLVADAYHAALAIEHGCEWVTTDREFARFPGLRWRHPLDG